MLLRNIYHTHKVGAAHQHLVLIIVLRTIIVARILLRNIIASHVRCCAPNIKHCILGLRPNMLGHLQLGVEGPCAGAFTFKYRALGAPLLGAGAPRT